MPADSLSNRIDACYLVYDVTYKSKGVMALQRNLRACHDWSIVVDGYYGSRSESAIEKIQRNAGIKVDGESGGLSGVRYVHCGRYGRYLDRGPVTP